MSQQGIQKAQQKSAFLKKASGIAQNVDGYGTTVYIPACNIIWNHAILVGVFIFLSIPVDKILIWFI